MIGLFKRLIAWFLEKLANRIPEPPQAQQDGYFDNQKDENLQSEIKKLLLGAVESLRKTKAETDSTEKKIKESLKKRILERLSTYKERIQSIPSFVKLIVLTTIPICTLYIIFYFILIQQPDTNTEDIFRFKKGKPLVRIGYVKEWPTSQVITALISEAMDNNLNVDITAKPVSQNALSDLWQMLVTNRADMTPSIWLPNTHAAFVADAGNKIVDLGAWLTGAKLGLVVPDYMKINSIDELTKENSGGIIYSIDPSSKLNHMTKRALELYGLKGFRIISKSDKYMVSRLEEALKKKENIVVTAWQPHWIFGEWKIKMLNDPLAVYGKSEDIHIFVTTEFYDTFPDICTFLTRIKLDLKEFSNIMASSRRLNSPAGAANKWLMANKNKVLEWDDLSDK